MLCWDDGREKSTDKQPENGAELGNRSRPASGGALEDLMEIFREETRELGNVRWIFWTWKHIMEEVSEEFDSSRHAALATILLAASVIPRTAY